MTNSAPAEGPLRGAALALLLAVDTGRPAGELARALAVEALRRLPPDSAGWSLAAAVLEGGPLRMRRAVDLAGAALDATDAAAAEEPPARRGVTGAAVARQQQEPTARAEVPDAPPAGGGVSKVRGPRACLFSRVSRTRVPCFR